MNLSDDAAFFFIHVVEEFPTLWDVSRADYADTVLKQSIWEHIVEKMKENWPAHGPYSVEALKRFFDNKRRTYRLERKKLVHTKGAHPSSDIYRGRWKFYKSLKFLDAVKVRRSQLVLIKPDSQVPPEMAEAEMPPVPSDAPETTEAATVDDAGSADEAATASDAVSDEGCTTERGSAPNTNVAALPTPMANEALSSKRRRNSNLPPPSGETWSQRQQVPERATLIVRPPLPALPDDACEHFGRLVAANMRSMPKARHLPCQVEMLKVMQRYMGAE
ncbi:hypothetical protein HPB50_014967 [Hyalomma asiaticum]|uniref:Uncharacterized protein n=1 Tax=Hyalomma asiaticum TaxID=266040 RepID=A0ACB7S2R7_HYAAI|nr:hypothetical protein HPB50_014967 [Hyalomma asiaticum]